MKELKLKVLKATVLLRTGTDHVSIQVDKPSPFPPEVSEDPLHLTFEVQAGRGENYCQAFLGIWPEIIDTKTGVRVPPFSERRKPTDITLIFIVNGEDVHVTAGRHTPIRDVGKLALEKSHNISDGWEIRDEKGRLVDPETKILDIPEPSKDQKVYFNDYPNHARFFLARPVGVGA